MPFPTHPGGDDDEPRTHALMQLAMEHGIEEGFLLDFRNFVWWLWKKLGLPAPTLIQYDIAKYLQSGPRRRMIQAFRGVGKSWITAAYVIWRLLKNVNERILVVSASKDRADAFSIFVKRLIRRSPSCSSCGPGATSATQHRVRRRPEQAAPSAVGQVGRHHGPDRRLARVDHHRRRHRGAEELPHAHAAREALRVGEGVRRRHHVPRTWRRSAWRPPR
jgi:hypothetical protein